MKTEPRYYVQTILSATGIGARSPHWVIDRLSGRMFDEFASKKAAQDTADYMNDVVEDEAKLAASPAPATDANGNGIWSLWASLPGHHDKEVTVVSGSYEDRSAIGNFLLDEGYTVYTD